MSVWSLAFLCVLVKPAYGIKHFHSSNATMVKAIFQLALFLSDWVLPVVGVVVAYFLFKYLFITDWDDKLYCAARDGDLKVVQEAIRKKANIEIKKRYELTPLMVAVLNNHGAIVSALIAVGAKVDTRDEEGRGALTFAAQKGFVDIVQMLLAKGADPNTKTFNGVTALILAAN